jgi:hypothetical protein
MPEPTDAEGHRSGASPAISASAIRTFLAQELLSKNTALAAEVTEVNADYGAGAGITGTRVATSMGTKDTGSRCCNRRRERADPLRAKGPARDLSRHSSRRSRGGPGAQLPGRPGSVQAQPRTLCPEGSFRRGQSAGQLRRQIVDAMIPGTRTAATEKGELALLVTVDPSLLDRLTPVFQAIGSRTVNAGAVAGSPTKPSHCGGFGQIR